MVIYLILKHKLSICLRKKRYDWLDVCPRYWFSLSKKGMIGLTFALDTDLSHFNKIPECVVGVSVCE